MGRPMSASRQPLYAPRPVVPPDVIVSVYRRAAGVGIVRARLSEDLRGVHRDRLVRASVLLG